MKKVLLTTGLFVIASAIITAQDIPQPGFGGSAPPSPSYSTPQPQFQGPPLQNQGNAPIRPPTMAFAVIVGNTSILNTSFCAGVTHLYTWSNAWMPSFTLHRKSNYWAAIRRS